HVELPRPRIAWPVGVEHPDQPVRADRLVGGDPRGPAAERGERAGLGAHAGAGRLAPWSSCRERTGASPLRLARMARCAALAPVMVVTQGMPRATAARRISQQSVRAPEPVGVLMTRST